MVYLLPVIPRLRTARASCFARPPTSMYATAISSVLGGNPFLLDLPDPMHWVKPPDDNTIWYVAQDSNLDLPD